MLIIYYLLHKYSVQYCIFIIHANWLYIIIASKTPAVKCMQNREIIFGMKIPSIVFPVHRDGTHLHSIIVLVSAVKSINIFTRFS